MCLTDFIWHEENILLDCSGDHTDGLFSSAIVEIYGAVFVADKRLYRFDAELGWAPKNGGFLVLWAKRWLRVQLEPHEHCQATLAAGKAGGV